MSHVAVKNEMIARRTTQVVGAHGHVTGVARAVGGKYASHLSRTCASRYRVEVAIFYEAKECNAASARLC